jgi:hypothetical protein
VPIFCSAENPDEQSLNDDGGIMRWTGVGLREKPGGPVIPNQERTQIVPISDAQRTLMDPKSGENLERSELESGENPDGPEFGFAVRKTLGNDPLKVPTSTPERTQKDMSSAPELTEIWFFGYTCLVLRSNLLYH